MTEKELLAEVERLRGRLAECKVLWKVVPPTDRDQLKLEVEGLCEQICRVEDEIERLRKEIEQLQVEMIDQWWAQFVVRLDEVMVEESVGYARQWKGRRVSN